MAAIPEQKGEKRPRHIMWQDHSRPCAVFTVTSEEFAPYYLAEIRHDMRQTTVEQAFRTCKTAPLEVRPIFVRREARTRAHAFVVMLAYQIIQYLTACWSPLDITVEEGLHALTTLCLVEVAPQHAASYHCIPTPRDAITRLLHSADIKLPKAFSLSGTRVSTKKKLPSERLAP
jgi:hypothetical protein